MVERGWTRYRDIVLLCTCAEGCHCRMLEFAWEITEPKNPSLFSFLPVWVTLYSEQCLHVCKSRSCSEQYQSCALLGEVTSLSYGCVGLFKEIFRKRIGNFNTWNIQAIYPQHSYSGGRNFPFSVFFKHHIWFPYIIFYPLLQNSLFDIYKGIIFMIVLKSDLLC